MEFLHGVTQCWLPGPSCQINWVAWGAIATASAAIVALIASRESARNADKATAISKLHLDEVQRVRIDMARVLAHFVSAEISGAAARCLRGLEAVDEAIDWAQLKVTNRRAMEYGLREFEADLLPSVEGVFGQLHTLPEAMSSVIAQFLAGVKAGNTMAAEVRESFLPSVSVANLNGPTSTGNPEVLSTFRDHLFQTSVLGLEAYRMTVRYLYPDEEVDQFPIGREVIEPIMRRNPHLGDMFQQIRAHRQ